MSVDIEEILALALVAGAAALIVVVAAFGGSLLGSLEKEEVGKTSFESQARSLALEACGEAQTPIPFGEGFVLTEPSRTKILIWGIPQEVEMGYDEEGRLISCELRD